MDSSAVELYSLMILLLPAEKERFVKGFTEKLHCYALGRPIAYADHLAVEQIVMHAGQHEYRLHDQGPAGTDVR